MWRVSRLNRPKTNKWKARLASEQVAIKAITRLQKWCSDRGYNIIFDKEFKDEIFYSEGVIKIKSGTSFQSQLISLLHECGHLKLNTVYPDYNSRFGLGIPKKNIKSWTRRPIHRIQLLEEEIEAWNVGEHLAKELHLRVDKRLWRQIRFRCLGLYLAWASK